MELFEQPQKSRVISGFPGFGLIGTITTEFLMEHLETRQIGRILLEGLPSTLAIHQGKMMDPIGIYYNENFNIVIIRGMLPATGQEWQLSEEIEKVIEKLNPYEIINVEGVVSQAQEDESKVYYYSNSDEKKNKLGELGLQKLENGIVVGVTSALLQKIKGDIICLFAETHSELPDSKAAAKIIEALDKYMGLNVDYTPLLEQAKIFEQKLKDIMQKSSLTQKEMDKKTMNYVG
jgi:uncharacterized protein